MQVLQLVLIINASFLDSFICFDEISDVFIREVSRWSKKSVPKEFQTFCTGACFQDREGTSQDVNGDVQVCMTRKKALGMVQDVTISRYSKVMFLYNRKNAALNSGSQ